MWIVNLKFCFRFFELRSFATKQIWLYTIALAEWLEFWTQSVHMHLCKLFIFVHRLNMQEPERHHIHINAYSTLNGNLWTTKKKNDIYNRISDSSSKALTKTSCWTVEHASQFAMNKIMNLIGNELFCCSCCVLWFFIIIIIIIIKRKMFVTGLRINA